MSPWATRYHARALSSLLLLGFLLALLLGAFHPLGLAAAPLDAHVCQDGAERHVDAPHDHEHDPSTCSFCHLARGLDAEVALAPLSLEGPAVVGRVPDLGATPAPILETFASSRPRAPPAA